MLKRILVVAVALTGVAAADAQAVTLDAVDSGWYQENNIGPEAGFHDPANENYIAGRIDVGGGLFATFRNFFVFDRSAISGPISSATLEIFNPLGGYSSGDASETYQVVDMLTDATTLRAGGSGLGGIFSDLGTGDLYGSIDVSAASDGQLLSIALSQAAIDDFNAGSGFFSVGGHLTTLGSNDTQFVFGGTADGNGSAAQFTRRLQVELAQTGTPVIPEPGTMALFGFGLIGGALRRKRQAA